MSASWRKRSLTRVTYLGATGFTKDVPKAQRLVAGACDDGLPVWRHGLMEGRRGEHDTPPTAALTVHTNQLTRYSTLYECPVNLATCVSDGYFHTRIWF